MSQRSTNWWQRKRGKEPVQPPAPIASEVTTTSMKISGTPMPSASQYIFQSAPGSGGPWTTISDTMVRSIDVTGLTIDTPYYFRRRYYIGGSPSPWSTVTVQSTNSIVAPPEDPVLAPVATVITHTTITLVWDAVADTSSYVMQRSALSGSGYSDIATITAPTLEYTDTGRTASTTYYYRFRAVNSDGASGPSPFVQVTTTAAPGTAPGTPSAGPVIGNRTSSSIALSLGAVATATEYIIHRSMTGTGSWTQIYRGAGLSFTHTGLTAVTTYYYRYAALNTVGQSAWSPTTSGTTTSVGTGLNVQPYSGYYIREHAGSCAHPNFNSADNVHKEENADEIVDKLGAAGFKFIRGMFSQATAPEWAAALRRNNMKWMMTLIPEAQTNTSQVITNQTIAETKAKVESVKNNYADVCAGFEGPNEPNHNKDGSAIASDWAQQSINYCKATWDQAHSPKPNGNPSQVTSEFVAFLGPSLHDTAVDNSNGGHWTQLKNLGLESYMTHIGLHTYPSGGFPTRKLDEPADGDTGRLTYIKNTFGDSIPVWCTEWGYRNCFGATGHRPCTKEYSARWMVRGYLQFITTVLAKAGDYGTTGAPVVRDNMYLTNYETMDDPDGNVRYTIANAPSPAHVGEYTSAAFEKHTGLMEVQGTDPSTWTDKPALTRMSAFLNALRDPDTVTADYTPNRVKCIVTAPAGSALQWQVTATLAQSNAGTATLWIWQDQIIWDRNANNNRGGVVNVPAITVTIEDAQGARTRNVDGEVLRLDLRA